MMVCRGGGITIGRGWGVVDRSISRGMMSISRCRMTISRGGMTISGLNWRISRWMAVWELSSR